MEAPKCKFCGHRHWGAEHVFDKPIPPPEKPKSWIEDTFEPYPKKEPKIETFLHNCLWCGKEFRGKWDRAFCCDNCRLLAWRTNKQISHYNPSFGLELVEEGIAGKIHDAVYTERCGPCPSCHPELIEKKPQLKHIKNVIPISWGTLRFYILQRDHFRCRYCGRSAEDGVVLHVDHIYPKSNGGKDTPDNLITACMECNLSKRDSILTVNPTIEFTTA